MTQNKIVANNAFEKKVYEKNAFDKNFFFNKMLSTNFFLVAKWTPQKPLKIQWHILNLAPRGKL
jgi:hypothetical protein